MDSPKTRIDGQVIRRGRNSTVWVNGQPYAEGEDAGGLRAFARRSDPGAVAVSVGKSSKPLRLRVGETLNRDSGEVQDVVGGGELRVNRPEPAAP
jgi:hypothetical protein